MKMTATLDLKLANEIKNYMEMSIELPLSYIMRQIELHTNE